LLDRRRPPAYAGSEAGGEGKLVTEAEWLAETDPAPMLKFLEATGRASDRKLRLLTVATLRTTASPYLKGTLSEISRYWEGEVTLAEVHEQFDWRDILGKRGLVVLVEAAPFSADTAVDFLYAAASWPAARETTHLAVSAARSAAAAVQCGLVRDIFGSPFRALPTVDPAWLDWDGGIVRRLGDDADRQQALPEGNLVPARLAVLADALEDAGCADGELLGHLRGPGPHVQGCWALDLILGKS
jgi:hypothetical protein